MLFHTYVGMAKGSTQARNGQPGMNSRQIRVQIKLHDFKVVGDPEEWGNRSLRIGVGQQGLNCALTYVDSGGTVRDARFGRDAGAQQWANGLDFTLNVPWDGLPHADKVGTCTVQPFVKFLGNPELMDSYFHLSPFFRDRSKITTFMWIARPGSGRTRVGVSSARSHPFSYWTEMTRRWCIRPGTGGPRFTMPTRPCRTSLTQRIPGAWNPLSPNCAVPCQGQADVSIAPLTRPGKMQTERCGRSAMQNNKTRIQETGQL